MAKKSLFVDYSEVDIFWTFLLAASLSFVSLLDESVEMPSARFVESNSSFNLSSCA